MTDRRIEGILAAMSVRSRFGVLVGAVWLLEACGSTIPSSENDGSTETETDVETETGTEADACEVTDCVTLVGTCDSESRSCEGPPCEPAPDGCEGPTLCELVAVGLTADELTYEINDTDAARCLLTALRDRTPGRLELAWGDFNGYGLDGSMRHRASIYSRGDGTVAMSVVSSTILATSTGYDYYATNDLALESVEYFAACVEQPSEAGLVACLIDPEDPSIEGLPWWTGSCGEFVGC